jgi:hypothetical protein
LTAKRHNYYVVTVAAILYFRKAIWARIRQQGDG